jgi:hypothetical protein
MNSSDATYRVADLEVGMMIREVAPDRDIECGDITHIEPADGEDRALVVFLGGDAVRWDLEHTVTVITDDDEVRTIREAAKLAISRDKLYRSLSALADGVYTLPLMEDVNVAATVATEDDVRAAGDLLGVEAREIRSDYSFAALTWARGPVTLDLRSRIVRSTTEDGAA